MATKSQRVTGVDRAERRWQAAEELATHKRTPAEYKAREQEYDSDSSQAMRTIAENVRAGRSNEFK